jgi:tetratricopeptide (TPR) repeat protein
MGKTIEATDWMQRCIAIHEKEGKDGRSLADSYLGLATFAIKAKDFGTASAAAEKALEFRLRYLNENHPGLLTYYSILAISYKQQGRTKEARPYFEKVLSIKEARFGARNENTLGTRTLLAQTLEAERDLAGARQQWERIVEGRAAGSNKRLHAVALNNLGAILMNEGKHGEAIDILDRAIAIKEALKELDKTILAKSYLNKAAALKVLKHYEEALPLAKNAAKIFKSNLPAESQSFFRANLMVKALTSFISRKNDKGTSSE